MGFIFRMGKFWFMLLVVCLGFYVSHFNRTLVPVSLPPLIDSLNLPAFLAYLLWFLIGALAVSVFFGFEIMRKSWSIRRLSKRLRQLEAQLGTGEPPSPHDGVISPREESQSHLSRF